MSTLPPPPHAMADGSVVDPAFVEHPTVVVDDVSVWFGQKVALSEMSCSFGPGVTGLLGPNGAGKTTLMRAMCGLIGVKRGSVTVLGVDPRTHRDVHARLALVPEEDAVPEALSPRRLATYQARLAGVTDRGAVDAALATVELLDVADRPLGSFSKGMRQRGKIAAALVTAPDVLVLDEPLNGADPVQRLHLIALFKKLGDSGHTVVVSSHVLHEVERMASRVLMVFSGRLAAAGSHRAIRDAMADRPRRVLLRSTDSRALAAALIAVPSVTGIEFRSGDIEVATLSAAELAVALPGIAAAAGVGLREVTPLDESLESVFAELAR